MYLNSQLNDLKLKLEQNDKTIVNKDQQNQNLHSQLTDLKLKLEQNYKTILNKPIKLLLL